MQIKQISATGQQALTDASPSDVSTVVIHVSGIATDSGSMTPQIRISMAGVPGTPPAWVNCAYIDKDAGTAVAAGTAITADGVYEISASGCQIGMNVTAVTAGYTLYIAPLEGPSALSSSSGGGGGGGGAVTLASGAVASGAYSSGSIAAGAIVDGADVALGLTTSGAVTGDNDGSVNAHLRGLTKIAADEWDATNHRQYVALSDGTHYSPSMDAVSRPGFQKITDGTNTMPTLDAVGRRGYIQLTDGTTAVGMDTSTASINVNISKDSTAAPTTPLQVSLWDQTLTSQQAIKAASTAAVAGDIAAVVAVSPNNVVKVGDGTTALVIKASTTAAATTDTSAVVALSPNSPAKIFDGTNTATVKAASTASVVGDTSLVVAISPNTPAKIWDGTTTATVAAASTAAVATDKGLVVAISPNGVATVGGVTTVIKPTFTVSTSPAYTSGDDAGGKATITSAVRVSAGTGVFQSLELFFKSGTTPTGTFLLFDADPSAATITDNTAFAWSTDQAKLIGAIPVASTDMTTINSQIVARPSFTPFPIKAASGTSLYAAYVLNSTPTFTATTDMLCAIGILQD